MSLRMGWQSIGRVMYVLLFVCLVISCIGLVYVSIMIGNVSESYYDLAYKYNDLRNVTLEWKARALDWRDMSNANHSMVLVLHNITVDLREEIYYLRDIIARCNSTV